MRFILFLFASLLTCHTLAGTELPAKCEACLPSIFLKKMVKETELEALQSRGLWGQDQKTNKYWTVYSDRCNNVTFSKPSLQSKQFDELDFNEQVRIAKIENDFALVYIEGCKGVIYPLISDNAKCKGWIPMKNLLLWSSCPVDVNALYKKAFLCLNIDSLRRYKGDKLKEEFSTYLDPGKSVKNTAKQTFNSRDICFAMKQENGLYLLSKTPNIFGDMPLLGWFTPSTVIIPFGNIYLEPNWTPSAVEELKGKRVPIYDRDGKEVSCFDIGRTNKISKNPTKKYRLEPEYTRFPLQNNVSDNDKQYVVTAFTPTDGCHDGECIQMAFTGFVDKKDSVTGLDYFTPVALFNSDELAYLLDTLKPTIQKNSTEEFRNKYRKLRKIRENKYDFSFERNKTTWYWIPVEYLP